MSLYIENNFGTVNYYGGDTDAEITRQQEAGVTDEVLEDIGLISPAPAESMGVTPKRENTTSSDTMDLSTYKKLTAEITMYDVVVEDDDHATLRAMNLQSVAGDKRLVSKARKREGFLTTNDPQPNDRKRVEALYVDAKRQAAINLRRACGHCALRNQCRIYKEPIEGPDVPKHEIVTPARAAEITLNRWIKRHPFADRADNKEQRARNQFSRELDDNPLKNCRPDSAKR